METIYNNKLKIKFKDVKERFQFKGSVNFSGVGSKFLLFFFRKKLTQIVLALVSLMSIVTPAINVTKLNP